MVRTGRSFKKTIGDEIDGFSHADAVVFVINDHRIFFRFVKTDDDVFVPQIGTDFVTEIVKRERIVLFDFSGLFREKEFVIDLVRRQESYAFEVESEAVDGFHADGGVLGCVVVVFDPLGELPVKGVQGGQVELSDKKFIAYGTEEPFDLSFGCAVAYGCVAQNAADACANEGDFLAGVDGAVVDVELVRDAAFVESCAYGGDHGVDSFRKKELAVAADAAGVVEKCDEAALGRFAVGTGNIRAVHGVGLPQLIGELHGECQAEFVIAPVVLEQLVGADEPVESSPCDLVAAQDAFFDAAAVDVGFVETLFRAEKRQDLVNGFEELFGRDFTGSAFVCTSFRVHGGNAVEPVTGAPGLDGSPGEAPLDAMLVDKGRFADFSDTVADGCSGRHVDGPKHPHAQISGRVVHRFPFVVGFCNGHKLGEGVHVFNCQLLLL
jgi:hypothetical protein